MLTVMSFVQSAIAFWLAGAQARFFEELAQPPLHTGVIEALILSFMVRAIWQFLLSSMEEYALVQYYNLWLGHWGAFLQVVPSAQRARLLSYDLKQWLQCLVQQGRIFFQDFFQLLFFGALAYDALSQLRLPALLFFGCYVIGVNVLSAIIQEAAIALEQQQDRIEGYWQARLYRRAQIAPSARQRYNNSLLAIYRRKRCFLFFDVLQQTLALLLPVLLLYDRLEAGDIAIQQYVLFSQASYNILPALSHLSQHRATWARGLACAKRLAQEASCWRESELLVSVTVIS